MRKYGKNPATKNLDATPSFTPGSNAKNEESSSPVKLKWKLKGKTDQPVNLATKQPSKVLKDEPVNTLTEDMCEQIDMPEMPECERAKEITDVVPEDSAPQETLPAVVGITGGLLPSTVRRRSMSPKLAPLKNCNNCAFAQQCPQFQADKSCAFLPLIKQWKFDTFDDLTTALVTLAETEVQRAQEELIHERLNGGNILQTTSHAMESAFRKVMQVRELLSPTPRGGNPIAAAAAAGAAGAAAGLLAGLFQPAPQAHVQQAQVVGEAQVEEVDNWAASGKYDDILSLSDNIAKERDCEQISEEQDLTIADDFFAEPNQKEMQIGEVLVSEMIKSRK